MEVISQLAELRLVAHQLAGPTSSDPLDAVTHLGAVQAQDLPGALLSIGMRTSGGTHAAVVEAFNTRQVVRSWPMRGTLHVVPAADLGWILSLTAARMLSGAATRRRQVGIGDDVLDTARQLVTDALDDTPALTRAATFELWREAGLLVHSQTAVHLLGVLCQEATLVLGPLSGREQLVVGYASWVPHPRRLGRDEALAEFARRFLTSHGPATVQDFARWSSLSLTESRAGFAAVRDGFASVTADSVEYLFDPRLPDLLAEHRRAARRVLLLPGFDEFILGYVDRTFAVPASHADRLVPGNNGMFRPSIIKNAQVIGTWRRDTRGALGLIAEGFQPLSPGELAATERAFAALPWPG